MNRKTYWAILFNPLFLILYGYGLYLIYSVCLYGNMMKRLPMIIIIGCIGLLWVIGWSIVYHFLKNKHIDLPIHQFLIVELAIILLLTVFYDYKIIQTATPYKGHLWTYLNDLTTTQKVELDDNSKNFLENGLDGILDILYDQCDLDKDWDLYTANTLSITVDEQGMIQSIYAFIYAFDEDNSYHSWLIDYDYSNSDTATIYLDNTANTDNISKQQLLPLLQMIDALLHSSLINQLDSSFTLKYSGYDTIDYSVTTTYYDFNYSENTLYSYHENYDEAFILQVYQNDSETLTILNNGDSIESSEDYENDTLVLDDNGMTYYLDESHSMSLIVVDAAAGSRAYAFENDYIYNEDPFNGRIGVAESIYFMDENTGFILIASASQDVSYMYYTTDGGTTFTEVDLSINDEDYDYINTPYKENNILYVTVSYDSSNESTILFQSTDNGQNWELVE